MIGLDGATKRALRQFQESNAFTGSFADAITTAIGVAVVTLPAKVVTILAGLILRILPLPVSATYMFRNRRKAKNCKGTKSFRRKQVPEQV